MAEALQTDKPLPVGSVGKRSGGWWGMVGLIVTEGSLFGYLLFSYFYLALQAKEHWPPEGLPILFMPAINTLILLSSSGFVWASERCLRYRNLAWSSASMALAVVLGVCFVLIQINEWDKKTYDMASSLYGSLFFTITGFHMLHVVIGLVILMTLLVWIAFGYFDDGRYAPVTIGGLYWHFVDVVWLFVFSTIYLTPYLY